MIRLNSVTVVVIIINTVLGSAQSSTCDSITKPQVPEVPLNFTDWSKKYPDYKPVQWNVQCEDEICDKLSPEYIEFGKVLNGVDRTRAKSCYRKPPYKLDNAGFPLNPAGRTGLFGRGMLPKWGPNHVIWLLLQRKSKSGHFAFMHYEESGARLPEFFVNSASGKWFDKEMEERMRDSMKRVFGTLDEAEKAIRMAEKSSKSLLKGSIPSSLNTDNSWIELHMRSINCMEHQAFCSALVSEVEDKGFEWLPVDYSRVKESYLKEVDEKIDIRKLDRYSAFCKIIALHSAKRRNTLLLPVMSSLLLLFVIILIPWCVAATSMLFILLPILALIANSVTLRMAFDRIFPKRCR